MEFVEINIDYPLKGNNRKTVEKKKLFSDIAFLVDNPKFIKFIKQARRNLEVAGDVPSNEFGPYRISMDKAKFNLLLKIVKKSPKRILPPRYL